MSDSRAEYDSRMHRVLAYIDERLDQALDLNTLAGVAGFSPYHFHRLFTAWMGETLGDYMRRRRLEMAAMRLAAQPKLPVLHVALSVGFGSSEAFARAFKTRFGLSPSAWRAEQGRRRPPGSKPDQVNRKPDQAAPAGGPENGVSNDPNQETLMNVQLIDREPVNVAYLRHVGPYGEPLSVFWRQTVYPWMAENGLLDRARYGLSHDDPGVVAPEQCRYDACVEIPERFVVSGSAQTSIIPGGRYAVLYFDDVLDRIGEAWTALLRNWLPSSGLQLDSRPCFEHYPPGSRCDPETGVFECEICIPVAPL